MYTKSKNSFKTILPIYLIKKQKTTISQYVTNFIPPNKMPIKLSIKKRKIIDKSTTLLRCYLRVVFIIYPNYSHGYTDKVILAVVAACSIELCILKPPSDGAIQVLFLQEKKEKKRKKSYQTNRDWHFVEKLCSILKPNDWLYLTANWQTNSRTDIHLNS